MPRSVRPALTPSEAAKRLGLSVRELAALRRSGSGPRHLVLNPRTIRYLGGDLCEWRDRSDGRVAS